MVGQRAAPGVGAAKTSRRFELAEDEYPAARSWWIHGERRPRAAGRASSVALVRDGRDGVETLLRHRPGPSALGRLAFPGGPLAETDDDACTWFGPEPAQWSRVLGVGDHRLARRHLTGAVRTLFDESGILLAGPDGHSVVPDPGGGEWAEARRALRRQEIGLPDLVDRRGYGLRTDLLRAVGRWSSPHFSHRRLDTQYFAAAVPYGQGVSDPEGMDSWSGWVSARRVVAGRDTTRLGDRVGAPDTAGRTLGALVVPAVELLLERMATAGSTVEFLIGLTVRGGVPHHTPELQGSPVGAGGAGPDGGGFSLVVDLPRERGRPAR